MKSGSEVKMLTIETIIRNTVTLVQEGCRVILPVKGFSIHPFTIGGRKSVAVDKTRVRHSALI